MSDVWTNSQSFAIVYMGKCCVKNNYAFFNLSSYLYNNKKTFILNFNIGILNIVLVAINNNYYLVDLLTSYHRLFDQNII